MDTDKSDCLEICVSDYAEIGSLQHWLSSTPNVKVSRVPGQTSAGEQGALDTLAIVAGSSGMLAALRMIPEFLRSRRTGLSVSTVVKGEKFTLNATNVDDVMPILERILDE